MTTGSEVDAMVEFDKRVNSGRTGIRAVVTGQNTVVPKKLNKKNLKHKKK
jgi:hypothetical protein